MPPAYATLVVGNPVTRPARNIKWGGARVRARGLTGEAMHRDRWGVRRARSRGAAADADVSANLSVADGRAGCNNGGVV